MGFWVASRRSKRQSRIAWRSVLFLDRKMKCGRFRRIALHGVKRLRPAGMDMKACRHFDMTDSNSFKGMPACPCAAALDHLCRMVRRNSRFGSSNCIVFATPSNVKPRMSFCKAHWPFNFLNFLRDRGSSSSSCLVARRKNIVDARHHFRGNVFQLIARSGDGERNEVVHVYIDEISERLAV